ncbi:hypothetical protein [Streptomyces sennicomposti]|uniref:hypothetical protein n=1 Tax=Streptomyces sennicomposti TaxID=2873384 RepID=UPI001FFC80F4|nr:hypothetical protein [Streptomyces sennicomposti]
MRLTAPPCPDCATATERIEVEGEEVWRCTAPDCTRRTYGTGDPDDDDALPPYTETDTDGAVTVYHGTGEIDLEATAELAAQDDPDDDPDDEEQPLPAAGAPFPANTGAPERGTSPMERGRTAGAERAPGTVGTPRSLTDSNDGAEGRSQLPQPGVGHALLPQCPAPSPRGHR